MTRPRQPYERFNLSVDRVKISYAALIRLARRDRLFQLVDRHHASGRVVDLGAVSQNSTQHTVSEEITHNLQKLSLHGFLLVSSGGQKAYPAQIDWQSPLLKHAHAFVQHGEEACRGGKVHDGWWDGDK